jgi:hypothetical protein
MLMSAIGALSCFESNPPNAMRFSRASACSS